MEVDRKPAHETDPLEERARIREELPAEGRTAEAEKDDPSARGVQPGAAAERLRDYD
jgi:hypothetical protein